MLAHPWALLLLVTPRLRHHLQQQQQWRLRQQCLLWQQVCRRKAAG
jgi:hypothetical protein